jgi:hypothetical protein
MHGAYILGFKSNDGGPTIIGYKLILDEAVDFVRSTVETLVFKLKTIKNYTMYEFIVMVALLTQGMYIFFVVVTHGHMC